MLLGRGSQHARGREIEATAVTCTTTGSFYGRKLRVGSWVYTLGRENVQRVGDEDDEGMKDSFAFGWVSHSLSSMPLTSSCTVCLRHTLPCHAFFSHAIDA